MALPQAVADFLQAQLENSGVENVTEKLPCGHSHLDHLLQVVEGGIQMTVAKMAEMAQQIKPLLDLMGKIRSIGGQPDPQNDSSFSEIEAVILPFPGGKKPGGGLLN